MGSFIIPLIANPFLAIPRSGLNQTSEIPPLDRNQTLIDLSTINSTFSDQISIYDSNETELNNNDSAFLRESRIEWAYSISALATVMVSLIFYYYQFYGNKRLGVGMSKDENPFEDEKGCHYIVKMVDPATCTKSSRSFGAMIIGLLVFFMFNIVGGERVFGRFIRSYAIDAFGMSGDNASLLNTSFWISFSFGRFIFFVLAKFIPIRKLVLLESGGALITSIIICLVGNRSEIAIWILTQPMGLFIAPLFPTCIGWANRHLNLTGIGLMFIVIGGAIGGVIHMIIIGYFYEYYGPTALLYHMVSYGVVVMACSLVLHFMTLSQHREYLREKRRKRQIEMQDMNGDKEENEKANI